MDLLLDFYLVLSIAIYHLYVISVVLLRYIRCWFWKEANAIINDVSLDVEYAIGELGNSIPRKSIKIEYQYGVAEKQYVGITLGVFDNLFAFTNYDEQLYSKLLDHYHSRSSISMRFNPKNPNASYLIRNIYSKKFIALCLSGFTFIGLTFWSYHRSIEIKITFVSILAILTFVVLIIMERCKSSH